MSSSRPLKNGEHDRERRDRDHKDGRRDRKGRGEKRDRKPRREEEEAPDGNVYRGYITGEDDFVKPAPTQGPPKYKSFGGKKRF